MASYDFHMIERGSRPSLGRFIFWLVAIAAIVAVDQAAKTWIMSRFALGESHAITPFFNLVYVRNTGAAFSFLAQAGGWQIWFFGALALIVTLMCVFGLYRYNHKTLLAGSFTLIAAGALGNFIDRALFGSVCDFLDFHWQNLHWPAFNIADISICIGAVLFLLAEFLSKQDD